MRGIFGPRVSEMLTRRKRIVPHFEKLGYACLEDYDHYTIMCDSTPKQKSGFPTDGRNHHAGVQNEKDIAARINAEPPEIFKMLYGADVTFQHRGGTSTNVDIDIIDGFGKVVDGISVKRHKGGTYDYINTSRVSDYLEDSVVRTELDKLRVAGLTKEETALQIKDCLSSALAAITSLEIKKLIDTYSRSAIRWMCVNDMQTKRIILFEHSEIDGLRTCEGDEFFLRATPKARTSATIWRRRNGVEVNTSLRIRLVLNNGVGAFLKLAESKNKSSVHTLKIQQDAVKALLSRVTSTVL